MSEAAVKKSAGIQVNELANQIGVAEIGAKATAMGVDIPAVAAQSTVAERTNQVSTLGYDTAKILDGAPAKNLLLHLEHLGLNIEHVAQSFGTTVDQLATVLNPNSPALQVPLFAHKIAELVLQDGGVFRDVSVNLQLPLKCGRSTTRRTPARRLRARTNNRSHRDKRKRLAGLAKWSASRFYGRNYLLQANRDGSTGYGTAPPV